jgi:thiol-disulfide isomerase/thioredoxin
MTRRSVIVGLVAVVLMISAFSALASDRTVLAEMFGAVGCGYCPNAREALVELQAEKGTGELVVLYYHVSDGYATGETYARASYYGVGGIPHVEFDAVQDVIGASPTVIDIYRPIVNSRLAVPSPIEIECIGSIVTEGTRGTVGGWVTAKFKATDTVGVGDLRAQFVVYEDVSVEYPFTVRDMLAPETVTTLSAAGDSIEFTKYFSGVTNSTNDPLNMHIIVFIEDTSPQQIVQSALMPDPYDFEMVADKFAEEIDYWGEATYTLLLHNTGTSDDDLNVDFTTDFPGDPYNWVANYCSTDGVCYMGAHSFFVPAGVTETLYVHIMDYNGTHQDIGTMTISVESNSAGFTKEADFIAFCDLTSILLVDDDGPMLYETYFQDALTDTGYPPYTWDCNTKGRPSATLLKSFYATFWTTASADAMTIVADDELAMIEYLNAGGNLCLASMNYLSSRSSTNTFITDYLHIDSWTDDTSGFIMNGVAGDMISDGMALSLLSGPFPVSESDSVTPASGDDVIFSADSGHKAVKISEDGHKVVFLAFPFECVKPVYAPPDNNRVLIDRIMAWFDFDETGVPDDGAPDFAKLVLSQNMPNPFNPTTSIQFSVPSNAGRVELCVYNVSGRLVRTLVNDELTAGPHSVVWNGKNDDGRSLASGIYFAKLTAGDETAEKKMAFLK